MVLCGRGVITSRNLCSDENEVGRDSQGCWSIKGTVGSAWQDSKHPHPCRSRQIFLTLAASLGFSGSQRRLAVCVHVDDNDDDDSIFFVSATNQFPTRSVKQLPSCLESCNWSITSVFGC